MSEAVLLVFHYFVSHYFAFVDKQRYHRAIPVARLDPLAPLKLCSQDDVPVLTAVPLLHRCGSPLTPTRSPAARCRAAASPPPRAPPTTRWCCPLAASSCCRGRTTRASWRWASRRSACRVSDGLRLLIGAIVTTVGPLG